jgi:hypothetical protein
MKSIKPLYVVIIAVLVGAAAFFGGMQYQKMQRPNFAQFGNGQFARQGGQGGQINRRFGQNGGGAVAGEITSQDDKSITVKMPDGSSKIVILSSTTSINKQATGSKDDLKTGERVAVFGQSNSDGSVTAQSIQLNPAMRGTRGTPAAK